MTDEQIRDINRDRLADWAAKLTENHATALLLLGVGHDRFSGTLHVFVPEDLTAAQIALLLRGALKELEAGRARR